MVTTGSPTRPAFVLDVDTGVDDALALLMALRTPDLDLRAVTCVAGNTNLDQVVCNTLKVMETVGRADVPVLRGASRPLIEDLRHAEHFHGSDGMGDLELPSPASAPIEVGAIEFLRQLLLDEGTDGVTMVCLGPLTNVALLLRTYPEASKHIERVVMMGGAAIGGNASPVAEFNVWNDPEAAAIVLGSGLSVTMYGLDVYQQVVVPSSAPDTLRLHGDPASCLAAQLLDHLEKAADPNVDGARTGQVCIGDAGALCCALEPALLSTRRLGVGVELAGHSTRGQTVVDFRFQPGEQEHHGRGSQLSPIEVGTAVDGDGAAKLFLSTLLGTATASSR